MPEIAYQSEPDTAAATDTNATDKDNSVLYRRLKGWFRDDADHWQEWREEAYEDYAFVSGDQWSADDVRQLKDQLRPVITFNRVDPIVRSVSGEQINNAQQVQYLPREEGDTKPNEILTSTADWFRDQCDADDEESEAFWDASICGVGVTDTRIEMEEDPEEPTPVIERIDPLEIIVDKAARKRNLRDARRIFRVKADIPIDEAREMYPDAADSDLDASWARLDDPSTPDGTPKGEEYEHDNESDDSGKDTVTIVECQWWERKAFYKALDPFTGDAVTLDKATHDALNKKLKAMGQPALQSVALQKRVFKRAFLGRTVLKVGESPSPERFTFNFITGFRDRNKGHFYGLVRGMKDPQRWANKWLSQTLHIMNVNAKGGVMMEDGAVEDQRKFEKSFADPAAVTWVPDGTLSNPQGPRFVPKPAPQFPVGFYQLMEFAVSSIRDTQGINLEMLGMREADQPASLEYQRRQAGVTILAPLFRAMRRYHRNQGQVMLHYIQTKLSDKTLVRIVGDGEFGAQPEQPPMGMPGQPDFMPGQPGKPPIPQGDSAFVRLKDIRAAKASSAKYDIVVDEGPTSPNQKERVWSLIGPHFFSGVIPPEVQMALIDYAPLPTSVIEAVKEASKQASESPMAKMQEQMAQFDLVLKQVQAQLVSAQAQKAQADAKESLADAALKGSQVGMPVGRDGIPDKGPDLLLKKYDSDQRAAVERDKAALKLQGDREKATHDLAVNREWMQNEQAIAAGRERAATQRQAEGIALDAMLNPKPPPAPPGQANR